LAGLQKKIKNMEAVIAQKIGMKKKMYDILVDISWAKIAKNYFGKSPSWIYHKIDEINDEFSESELEQFKNALFDLSRRIRIVAENI
jgi:hypothetical protein